ncbi:helix-turn-helix domain-containing protein [Companilactobacillus mishanensis]|uniref:Helix-turn-helix transcriptional regulator n=1 Tax=Companilactobacillus mishanensis TaxID=2486008 RepID=A0ABW9P7W8_9LACO|nr:helix-turn-helix transcriptional regulator [Companilactobacillus mishanensis]MQS45204.1 helix-turn-helix transcriptional regulator [Companilactobacillus mishanensis]MQS89595.1 helix-turn-helix transcriptional regulator [Companilactobacillus mishanensis]
MNTWSEFKDSISDDEMTVIDTLSQLQAERLKRGISQKDFAETIGMKQPQLAKIERLDSVPSLVTLNRYAHGLGLEIKLSIISK